MKASLLSILAVLPLVAACTAATVSDDTGSDSDSSALSVASVSGIDIGRSSGFGPPPPPGGCMPFSSFSVDFSSSTLTGNACIANKHVSVDHLLSADELASVKKALAHVKKASRPTACATDMPITSLTVHRGQSSTFYVDQIAACGGSTPAVSSTLAALLDTVEGLATSADSCEAAGGECKSSPTDVTFPALCDKDFGMATLPGRCGAINQACCAKPPTHCPLTGILCTLDCPNTGHIGGAPCTHGQWDEPSCQCLLVGP